MDFGFAELRSLVIDRGLCTVCGTCIGICPRECLDLVYKDEEPLPELKGECSSCGLCYKACPGADIPMPELEKFCFGKIRENKPDDLGIFNFSGAGHAIDPKTRHAGASGGVATALLTYGLESGLIDCAVVAGFSPDKPWRTEAKLATNRNTLLEAAQSKYAVVATNSLLGEAVRRGYQKIGLVGCPCHIEAIRKAEHQALAPNITQKIKILLGLFCGGNFYFEGTRHALIELLGLKDIQHITKLQYRGRREDSWESYFMADLDNGEQKYIPRIESIVKRFNLYPRLRCEICIDWSAELADISLGDCWESNTAGPSKGQNYSNTAFLVRTDTGKDWILGAQKANYIDMHEASPEQFIKSQPFEMKKHANVHRITVRKRHGWPTPDYHFPLIQESFKPKG